MTQIKRAAPDPEWVQMYRQGTTTSMITVAAGVAESTVRYHLGIAARQDACLRSAHRAAARPTGPRITAAGQQNLADVLALYRAVGRLPGKRTARERALAIWLARHSKTEDKEERTLGVWLHTQRIDARAGRLTATREALLNKRVPGWREGRPRGGSKTKRPSSAALRRQS